MYLCLLLWPRQCCVMQHYCCDSELEPFPYQELNANVGKVLALQWTGHKCVDYICFQ